MADAIPSHLQPFLEGQIDHEAAHDDHDDPKARTTTGEMTSPTIPREPTEAEKEEHYLGHLTF